MSNAFTFRHWRLPCCLAHVGSGVSVSGLQPQCLAAWHMVRSSTSSTRLPVNFHRTRFRRGALSLPARVAPNPPLESQVGSGFPLRRAARSPHHKRAAAQVRASSSFSLRAQSTRAARVSRASRQRRSRLTRSPCGIGLRLSAVSGAQGRAITPAMM